jgi:signal transduction histidine kinase
MDQITICTYITCYNTGCEMTVLATVKTRFGALLVTALGAILVALHVIHALEEGGNMRALLFGIVIPVALSVGVIAGGVWLWRENFDREQTLRVTGWCLVGTAVLLLAALFTILYQESEGVQMSDQLFILVNGASGGAAIGLLIGVYDRRQCVARAEAAKLSQQLTVLNRVLRHDIRNDANVIQSNAALLAEDRGQAEERARTIKQQATDLVQLGEHAKEIERLLHGDELDREVIDIDAVVSRICKQIRDSHSDATIDVSIPNDQQVIAHPLISSALRNVIENGLEHNDADQPRVQIQTERQSVNGTEMLEVCIADTGPGIPAAEQEVLERGYETELEHASGLGLWLVNWILRKSDGEIQFEENEPRGSVVRIQLERAENSATVR